MIKKIILALLALGLIGAGVGTYMWFKPHQKVEDAKSIVVTAVAITKEYAANEKNADSLYLNKAIEVTGTVAELEKNQDGGMMLILGTDDPMMGVQCTMREKNTTASKGQQVTIKGFCSGNGITGITLTDCIIKQ